MCSCPSPIIIFVVSFSRSNRLTFGVLEVQMYCYNETLKDCVAEEVADKRSIHIQSDMKWRADLEERDES